MEIVELFTVLNALIGLVTPIAVQYISPKLEGWGKLLLAAIFCIGGGVIATGVEGGFTSMEMGNIFGNIAAVFIVAEASWKGIWKATIENS